jgi:hypothetical protein
MHNIIKSIAAGIGLLFLLVLAFNLVHRTDDTEWQAVQYMNGEVEIKESAGIYFAFFPKVTEYARNASYDFNNRPLDGEAPDESIRVTFNDGGTAEIDTTLRISSPLTKDQKREFHRQFNGSKADIKKAVWAHLTNSIKSSGPVMSASENQTSRKSEFSMIVTEQLNAGLYEMKRVMVDSDQLDEKGNKLRIWATEVQRDTAGKPIISQISPLATLGIRVTQLSVTRTEYDKQTQIQFETKKSSFLKAESAKAEREGEVQQRLMIQEKGLRERAETEALANQAMAKATIAATQEKVVAETEAAKVLSVAVQTKATAETMASQKFEVAKIERLAAEENAKTILVLAQAEKDKIALGGAISEKDRLTLQTQQATAIGVAEALARINVPQVTIGGSSGANGSNNQADLINLFLLKQNGLLDAMKLPSPGPAASDLK